MSSFVAGASEAVWAVCCAKPGNGVQKARAAAKRIRGIFGTSPTSFRRVTQRAFQSQWYVCTLGVLAAGCFAGLRVVVALAVNGWDSCAHTAQIGGKLATVVNRMMKPDHHKGHRG